MLEVILIIGITIILIVLIFLFRQSQKSSDLWKQEVSNLRLEFIQQLQGVVQNVNSQIQNMSNHVNAVTFQLNQKLDNSISYLSTHMNQAIAQMVGTVTSNLQTITESTGQMNQRLDNASKIISELMKQVGEMKEGANQIKNIGQSIAKLEDLFSVQQFRGRFGEIMLENRKEQIVQNRLDIEKIADLIRELLIEIGEDPEREGLKRTPIRVAEAFEYFTKGYREEIEKVLNGAIFNEKYNEMVVVKNIDFFSLCEHHLLPFYGKVHIAYIPNGKIVGLSKIPRIVEVFSRRLQVQERLTQQIADTLNEYLNPKGVAVVIEARHLCMIMRGVEKQNSVATTSAMHGVFVEDAKTRDEFMHLISQDLT